MALFDDTPAPNQGQSERRIPRVHANVAPGFSVLVITQISGVFKRNGVARRGFEPSLKLQPLNP
jgi:hypothetical protein